ncbi:MAG: hypothetical protein WAL71_06700 [Terriglobales bacterium]|jgi:phosphoserine phosphatase
MDSTDSTPADAVLNELCSALEAIETQTGAILQFLKEKGVATDKELAPYLQSAGNASNVRWRAERLRINSLLASALKSAEESLTRKVEKALRKEQDKEQRNDESKDRNDQTPKHGPREEIKKEDTANGRAEKEHTPHNKTENKSKPEAA